MIAWKTTLQEIKSSVSAVKRGKVYKLCSSAGGRDVDLVFYGRENKQSRTANLSSALGAKDVRCYTDRLQSDYRPTVLFAGCIHGAEFEGTAALLNLISLLETGSDLFGNDNSVIKKLSENNNILIIPCLNPDGRARVPFNSMIGESLETLRYYNQGTTKDGKIREWLESKTVHPAKEHSLYLGGYYNDDGINLMHDNFFINPSNETKALFETADRFTPDITVLLHGGINGADHILKPAHTPVWVKESILGLENKMKERCDLENIRYDVTDCNRGEENNPTSSFNLCSAVFHLCGTPCITFESNQGLNYDGAMDMEKIYKGHIILFEEVLKYISKGSE